MPDRPFAQRTGRGTGRRRRSGRIDPSLNGSEGASSRSAVGRALASSLLRSVARGMSALSLVARLRWVRDGSAGRAG